MRLKYKVVLMLLGIALVSGILGYVLEVGYVFFASIIFFALSLSTLSFSDKDDKSIPSILVDGIFFSLI